MAPKARKDVVQMSKNKAPSVKDTGTSKPKPRAGKPVGKQRTFRASGSRAESDKGSRKPRSSGHLESAESNVSSVVKSSKSKLAKKPKSVRGSFGDSQGKKKQGGNGQRVSPQDEEKADYQGSAAQKKSSGRGIFHRIRKKLRRYIPFIAGTLDISLRDEYVKKAVDALGIRTPQLRTLRFNFDDIDTDDSGKIDLSELLTALGEKESPFNRALFNMIDVDGSGDIEFDEYCRVVVTFCMYSKEEILKFAFDCFDKDNSGTIDEDEFVELCQGINTSGPLFAGNFADAIKQFDVDDDGLIDFREFQILNERYPMVLYPAFRLQERMWQRTLGERPWVRIRERIEKAKKMREYIKLHGHPPPEKSLKKCRDSFIPCLRETPVDLAVFHQYELHANSMKPLPDPK